MHCGHSGIVLSTLYLIPASMRSLEDTLRMVEDSYDEMVETMIGMISIPALAPVNGGDGESRKAN